jgi:TRAP transporter TAXI family solute receptor
MRGPCSLRILTLALAWIACVAMAAPPPQGPPRPDYFSIATGSTAGSYFPVGSAIATILSHPAGSVRCEVPLACGPEGLIAVAVSSPGSVANVRDIAAGRVDSGFVQANIAAWAYRGTETFKGDKPYTDLRTIGRLYPEAVHLVVARGEGIKSLKDLRGRRISIDVEGSGTHVEALRILAAERLSKRNVDLVQANADRSANLLAAHEIDGFFFVGGAPVPTITALTSSGVADLVPITGRAATALERQSAYFTPTIIPEGTYPGVGATPTLAVGALWVVRASEDPDLIYRLTAALWDPSNADFFLRNERLMRQMSLSGALDGVSIPLHPGAERFYVEKGLIKPQTPPPAATDPGAGKAGEAKK